MLNVEAHEPSADSQTARKQSWATIATKATAAVDFTKFRTKHHNAKNCLVEFGYLASPTQRLTPVYFRGIKREPISQLNRCLPESVALPSCVIQSLYLIGINTWKFLFLHPKVDRLTVILEHIGFYHLPNYDPIKPSSSAMTEEAAVKSCALRLQRCPQNCGSPLKKSFYCSKLGSLKRVHGKTFDAARAWYKLRFLPAPFAHTSGVSLNGTPRVRSRPPSLIQFAFPTKSDQILAADPPALTPPEGQHACLCSSAPAGCIFDLHFSISDVGVGRDNDSLSQLPLVQRHL